MDVDSPVQRDETAWLALVARHVADAVVVTDGDGRVVWANEAFERTSGFTRQEVVGRLRVDLIRGAFTRTPEFVELASRLVACEPVALEFPTRTRDGSTYWVALAAHPLVEDGRTVGLIVIERDVTGRRQAEERARQMVRRAESLSVALRYEKALLTRVLATVPLMVWWKSADLRYVGANPAFLELRGVGTQAEIVGRLEGQLDAGDDLGPQIARLEASVLAGGAPVVDAALTFTPADGKTRTLLVNVLPNSEAGQVVGVIGVGADVSRGTELERELTAAGQLESIGQLAAELAQEINAPVQDVCDHTRFVSASFGAVRAGLSQLSALARDDDSGDIAALRRRLAEVVSSLDLDLVTTLVPNALEQSLEGLERVTQMVSAMKDFTRPGSHRVPTDLNRIVETTARRTCSEWGLAMGLQLDLDPVVGLVPCDEGEIEQVLENVVVNAVRALEERRRRDGTPDAGRLRVSTRRADGAVVLVVEDDGIGMDEATLRLVVDPSYAARGGAGQGLSVAQRVVDQHGGRIDVRSRLGHGTTVTIALPYDDDSDDAGATA